MYNNQNDIRTRLSAPFDDGDIEWRLQWSDKNKENGIAVPYVTNRAIQTRLDSVFGVGGWKNEFIPWHSDGKKSSQLCGISVWLYERGEWITKYDGADDSDIEPVKGGLSDSMKRAAVQWGIGRYLYSMPTVYVKCEARGNSAVIAKGEYPKLNKAHRDHVKHVFGQGGTQSAGTGGAADDPENANTPETPTPAGSRNTQKPRNPQTSRNGATVPGDAGSPNAPAKSDIPPKANAPTKTPGVPKDQPGRGGADSQTTLNTAKTGNNLDPNNTAATGNTPNTTPAAPSASHNNPPPRAAAGDKAAYTVVKAVPISSVKRGRDTNLLLTDADGRQTQAFLRGTDPGLTPGTVVTDVVITEKLSDGVIFRILEQYNITAYEAA